MRPAAAAVAFWADKAQCDGVSGSSLLRRNDKQLWYTHKVRAYGPGTWIQGWMIWVARQDKPASMAKGWVVHGGLR